MVADSYDRVRPGYPEELIDAVIAYGALRRGDLALDVGAGTGQATVLFAERGLSMVALDLSAEMVALANERFARSGLDAVAVAGEFESTHFGAERFRLICAATSWHWLDPERGVEVADRLIAPGGTLAVLSTWPLWRRTPLRPALDAAYARSGAPPAEMGPLCPLEPDPGALAREWVRDTGARGCFTDQQGKLAAWSVTYTTEGYVELLGTYGDHIGLDDEVRERLFDGVARVVARAGGTIEVAYSTLLLLARARQP